MKTIRELEDQNLHWVQPSMWRSVFELRTEDGSVLATITRTSWFKSTVEVDAVGNRWVFDVKGLLRRSIIIRSVGTGEEPAHFVYKGINGGELTFADGRLFLWKPSNFWGSKWVWTTAEGDPIMGFKTGGALKLNSEISLDPETEADKAPPLLVFLGWYLYLLYVESSAAF